MRAAHFSGQQKSLGHRFRIGLALAGNVVLLAGDCTMLGVVVLHWTLVLTVGLGCFIVRVMKGPAYVTDAFPFPDDNGASITRP